MWFILVVLAIALAGGLTCAMKNFGVGCGCEIGMGCGLFAAGLCILAVGYFTYGKFIEKIVAPDDRETPAKKLADGVDYVVLPHWKNMLIQLLNIAGIGPVIGVIIGIKFGVIAFLIIPVGNIIGGAVHDFLAGMISVRHDGANLPAIIKMTFGKYVYWGFALFMVVLLLLVVAVFINVPANLICDQLGQKDGFWWAVGAIFMYYIIATLFPVDKIIGMFYPVFGGLLLLGTFAVCVMLFKEVAATPAILSETEAFKLGMFKPEQQPIIPMLFVTIACGILSGFHATQAPIIARTMASEREGSSDFYGMMVVEGLIAMIWAAAALAIYNIFPALMAANPNSVLFEITKHFLGGGFGALTVISVIILAVTSGDTAMRSLRLSLAEMFGLDQSRIFKRVLLCLPLVLLVAGLLYWSNRDAKSFGQLWNYFAWGNQTLACFTLMAATVILISLRKPGWIAAVPGVFMTFVALSYILWISPEHGGPLGFGLPLRVAYAIAGLLAVAVLILSCRIGVRNRRKGI